MMDIKKSFYVSALLIAVAGFSSCEDMLTEKPDSYYTLDQYFTDEPKAEMTILGIYNILSNGNHYGSREMAVGTSDDTTFPSRLTQDGQVGDMGHYLLGPTNKWVGELWMYKYQMIDRANYAITGITRMAGYEDNTALKQLVAEARFLRAFAAFDLVKAWGDVPFKTTYSATYDEAFNPRSNREEIYKVIIEDLNAAKEGLPWHADSDSPERASQGAARALLMRVLLQRAGYSLQQDGILKCPDETIRKQYFEDVIAEWEAFQVEGGNTHDFFDGSYEDLFRSFSGEILNSRESLFEVAFTHAQGKRNGGWWGTYNGPSVAEPMIDPTEKGKYMGRANSSFRAVPEWYEFYDENDTRRDVNIVRYQWKWDKNKKMHVKSNTLRANSWYPGKWRREWMPIGFDDLNYTNVNFCPLRYADVVLMAAEAYNETDNSGEALRLINLVRKRAGAAELTMDNYASLLKAPKVYDLPFINDADMKGKIRTALYWERGFELCYEGQRKFDLIRWGVLAKALQLFGSKSVLNTNYAQKLYPAYSNFVSGKHELLPIPLSEMQSNSKLEGKNNNGY